MIYKNRTQEEINYDIENLSCEIYQLNKDFHDNCESNTCEECHCAKIRIEV